MVAGAVIVSEAGGVVFDPYVTTLQIFDFILSYNKAPDEKY